MHRRPVCLGNGGLGHAAAQHGDGDTEEREKSAHSYLYEARPEVDRYVAILNGGTLRVSMLDFLRALDVDLFRLVNVDLHRDWLDPYFTVLSYSGLGASIAILCLMVLAYRPTRSFALPLGVSTAVSGFLLADVIKKLVDRERPSHLGWAIVQEPFLYRSFPSGHTAAAFGFAVMLYFMLCRSESRWLGWIGLGWAGLVAVSRVYRGVHWPSDVVAGALCGFVAAGLTYTLWERRGWLPPVAASGEGVEDEFPEAS